MILLTVCRLLIYFVHETIYYLINEIVKFKSKIISLF
jgi:hypothetical protein